MRPRKPFSRALFLGQGVIREGLAVAILVRGSRARGSRAQVKQLFVDQVMSFFDELKAICVNADFWTSLGRCANPNLLLRLTRTLCETASHDVEVACILRQVRDLELARCNVGLHEIRSDGLDQLRFGLSYLDAQSVSRVRSMNKWWHKEASADAVWKPLGIAEWPSTKALHWNSLVKSGYISYFFRRRQLENSEGWKVEMSPCTPLAKDFGVIVELNAGERSVIHTYLDLSAHASQGVTAILDGQGHFPITWDELEALTLTVLLHRKADDKLLRLLVNAPSCGRDMMGIPSPGMLGHICFHPEEDTGVEFIPPCLGTVFDERHYSQEQSRQTFLSGPPWVEYFIILDDVVWSDDQVSMLAVGRISCHLQPRIGSGGFWFHDENGRALFTVLNSYGSWV